MRAVVITFLKETIFCTIIIINSAFAMDNLEKHDLTAASTNTSELKSRINEHLEKIKEEKGINLLDEVKKLPQFKHYKKKEIALDTGILGGSGLTAALILRAYARGLEDSLKNVFPEKYIDQTSELLITHPWLYPALAVTASIGGAAWYAHKKLTQPFELHQDTELIIAGFQQGQGSRLSLQTTLYENSYDQYVITEEDNAILRDCLKMVGKFVQDTSSTVGKFINETSDDEHEQNLINYFNEVQLKLDKVMEIKKNMKKIIFKNDPITKTVQTLVTAVGLGLLQRYPQTRASLLDQSPDTLAMLAAAGIAGSFMCNYIQKRERAQWHQEMVDFLKNREQEKCKQAADNIVEFSIESITRNQEKNRETARDILKINDPLKDLLKKYQARRVQDLEKVSLAKEDYKHLLVAVNTILDAFLNSLEKDDKK